MGREAFLRGALILAIGGLISRGLGAFYRFLLPWIMGPKADYGIGLFNYAYPIYVFFLGISSTGVPSAVAKLVAENLARGRRDVAQAVFRVSLQLMAGLGLALSLLLFLGAPYYARYVVHEPLAAPSVMAVAPAVLLVSLMSAYRGFFQGFQQMGPTAVSQVLEQLVRIGTMLFLAWLLLPRGIEYSAAGATFGAVTGAVAGLIYLVAVYLRAEARQPLAVAAGASGAVPGAPAGEGGGPAAPHQAGDLLRQIVALAVPVSLVGVIQPLIQVLDSLVVPLRLHAAGFDSVRATSLYGILTGFAAPFIIAPTVFAVAVATSLLPAVSESAALGDREALRRKSDLGLRFTLLLVLPSAAILLALSREIPATFFNSPETGLPLALLAVGTVFLGLQQTSSAFLYGLGAVQAPVRSLLSGAAVKLLVTWVLTGLPSVHINGAALGTTLGFLVAAWTNLRYLEGRLGARVDWPTVGGRAALASAAMAVLARLCYLVLQPLLGLKLATLLAVLGGGVAYAAALPLLGGITARELALLPGAGPWLAGVLRRLGLLRG